MDVQAALQSLTQQITEMSRTLENAIQAADGTKQMLVGAIVVLGGVIGLLWRTAQKKDERHAKELAALNKAHASELQQSNQALREAVQTLTAQQNPTPPYGLQKPPPTGGPVPTG